MDKIECSIQKVMSDVFSVEMQDITIESSQDNIDTWDSVNHLNLITALEEEFQIEIPIEEVGLMVNFRLICAIVKELVNSKCA